MLQDGEFVPGVEGDDCLQHRWQVFGLAQHTTPFIEPGIFVPVKIIDESVPFAGISAPWPLRMLDRSLRTGQYRIDGGIIDTGEIVHIIIAPLPFCIDRGCEPKDASRLRHAIADQTAVRRLSQSPDTLCGQGPIRQLRGDAPASAQHVAGDCQLIGGWPNIPGGVVEDEVSRWTSSPSIHSEAQA